MQVPFPFFKSRRSHRTRMSSALALGMACLRPRQLQPKPQTARVDRCPSRNIGFNLVFRRCSARQNPSLGKFSQHQCNTQKDSLLGMDILAPYLVERARTE